MIGSTGWTQLLRPYQAMPPVTVSVSTACAGGDSRVPLGFVSFTENAATVAMAIWTGATRLL